MDDDLCLPDLRTCGSEHLTRMEGEVSLPDLRTPRLEHLTTTDGEVSLPDLEHLTTIDGDGTGSTAHRHPGRSKRHLRRTRAPTGSEDDSGRHHWHGAMRGNSPELFNPPYLPAGILRPTSKVADLLSIPDAAIECYARNVVKVCKVCRVCRR